MPKMISTEERRQLDAEERMEIYNDIQMLVSGRGAFPAIEALADAFTVAIVQAAQDLQTAREIFSRLMPIMTLAVDNNWEIHRSRGGSIAPGGTA